MVNSNLVLVIFVRRCETYHKDVKKMSHQFIRYLNETKNTVLLRKKAVLNMWYSLYQYFKTVKSFPVYFIEKYQTPLLPNPVHAYQKKLMEQETNVEIENLIDSNHQLAVIDTDSNILHKTEVSLMEMKISFCPL